MATSSLQSASAQAKPLTLWEVGMKIETLECDADELAALIFTAARDDQLDPETRSALRAMGKLASTLGCEMVELREAVYASSKAERGENVAEFTPRG